MNEQQTSLDQGRYKLRETIGRGGMATVYRAFDTRLEVERAVKVLHPELTHQAQARHRFEHEARTLARLQHEHLVTVHDVGVDGERVFIVMEWLPSGSLDARVRAEGPLPLTEAVDIIDGVLAGLGHAHANGVIHRDVKPQNVLLTASGAACLADFGIARAEASDAGVTRAGAMMGTFAYMAPEQRQSATYAEARTDLYAVAATFYAILTGKQPVDLHVLEGHAAAFEGLPPTVCGFIARGTRFHVDDRFADAEEMRSALRALVHTAGGMEPLAAPVLAHLDQPRDSDTFEWTTDGMEDSVPPRSGHRDSSGPVPAGGGLATATASSSPEQATTDGHATLGDASSTLLERPDDTATTELDAPASKWPWVIVLLPILGLWFLDWGDLQVAGPPAESVAWYTGVAFTGAGIEPQGPSRTPGRVGQSMWRVRSEQGLPVELTRVNGADRMWRKDELFERRWPAVLHLVREGGELRAIEERNELGSVVHRMAMSQIQGGIEVHHQNSAGAWDLRDLSLDLRYPGFPEGDAPVIERYTLDEHGRFAEGRWFNASGQPTIGPDGAWGARYTWDERGRPLRRVAIDTRGAPMFSNGGVIHAVWSYEEEPPSTTVHFEAFGGVRTYGAGGVHAIRETLDAWGRVVRLDRLDTDLNPILGPDDKCASVVWSWAGERVARTCLGVEGVPIPDGSGCATREAELDERQYPRQRRCLDVSGEPVARASWAMRDLVYNEHGRLTVDGPMYRADGSPRHLLNESESVASVQYVFDEDGFVVEQRRFDVEGKLTLGEDGAAIIRDVYEDGRLTERRSYGTDSMPIANKHGESIVRQRWDERGYRVEYSTFDTVGRPVVTDRGWARLEEAFDDAGRSTRIALYDAEGGLSESGEEGWAIMEQTTEGSTRTTSYRDKQGDLKVSTDGYARMIEILDPRGLVVEQQFFGADGEPVALTEGEIGMTVSYDAAGRILETRLLGDPASFTTTCARSAYAYDARGNTTRFGCRDGEGAPVPKEDWSGASDMIGEYDGRDRVIRMWLEDSSGEQLVNIEGCLETRYDYDSEGEKTAICVPPPGGGEGGAAADDTP